MVTPVRSDEGKALVVVDRPAIAALGAELQAGRVGTPEERAIRLAGERAALIDAFDRLLTLGQNRIEEYPHQVQTVRRALREMRGRALLADEVGLGKTIEAALILQELRARGLAETALILTPPGLTRQWQQELQEKFGLEVPVVEKPTEWTRHPVVIGSLDMAKQERHAGRIQSRAWDLVIVDEAHRLANNRTLAWKLLDGIRRRYLLLLTATPVQNDLRELYNLVTLLRPGQLGSFRHFRRRFVDRSDPRRPANAPLLRQLLSECMVRHRRTHVGLRFTERRVHLAATRLSPDERDLYEAIADLSRGRRLTGEAALTRLRLLQEACSSATAVAGTLSKLARADPALQSLAAEAEGIQTCAKADAVVRIVRDIASQVLVFTEYRASQERIRRRLAEAGIEALLYHGGLARDDRFAVVERFRAGGRVLVSTGTGGEGHNLQFCHVLVNFDLPWNPMRLEQRIGRIHRLGQQQDVNVFNLAAQDTVEADILRLLSEKIRMFELVVGELDLVLGLLTDERSFEEQLARIWLESPDTESYRIEMELLAERVALARARFEQVREAEAMVSRLLEE